MAEKKQNTRNKKNELLAHKKVDEYMFNHDRYNFVTSYDYKNNLKNKYPYTLWGEFINFHDVPNMRYYPKSVWNNFEPIK